ncbi:response regulator [Pseudomonas sp. ArH3a]|nr:response regulator [Pseudomonas sp. ArH3a]
MGGALFWGGQRIISQEQERISVDFSLLTQYMGEQQALLKRLGKEPVLESGDTVKGSPRVFGAMDHQHARGATLFQGISSRVETPFTMICEDLSHCPFESLEAGSFGRYLADLYTTFWVQSSFPASTLLVIDSNLGPTYTVPTVGSLQPKLSAPLVMAAIAAIRSSAMGGDEIRWIQLKNFPEFMIAFTPLYNVSPREVSKPGEVYAATITHRDRINVFSHAPHRRFYDAYWLESRHDGLLLGERPQPHEEADGIYYRMEGLVFRVSDGRGVWTGYYMQSYQTLFLGHSWLLIWVLLLMLLTPLAGWSYMRWYHRRVIAPAQISHRQIVQSDQFSRTLLETSPVALCVFSREDVRVVFANTLALKWFGTQVGQPVDNSGLDHPLVDTILHATEPGEIESYQSIDGRSFYIAYAPTHYHNDEVVICAFADLSARAEMEQELTLAKQAADKANGAKSIFLATMSHEIRTPLYGVLGSLEILGLTDLDPEQRQLHERIQVSSALLLQIISDILDITKIESGQLSLARQAFDPRALVQSCTATYADIASQKNVLLFSCIDPTLPPLLLGDPVRISQVLTNLIGNAVKFTHSGHITVRARAEPGPDGQIQLLLQVTDTGMGIGKEEQKQLFTPFYQIDAHSHTVHGAGLGLSICAKLAALMGSELRLTSELGLGSSFSMSLELPIATGAVPARQPELGNAQVYVRSPHHELTDNLCQWLKKWGARAQAFDDSADIPERSGILLNLFDNNPGAIKSVGPYLTEIALGGLYGDQADACDFRAIGFLVQRSLRGELYSSAVSKALALQDNSTLPLLRLNVLIAEDNQINQATLSHQLKQLGCQSTLAADGAEALELWKAGDFDVLLTDVNMPRMNGYELTSILRASGDDRTIIGVTANAMHDEEERCKAVGMDAWLVKPVQLRTLWNSLSELSSLDPQESSTQLHESLPGNFREIFVSTMTVDIDQLREAIDGEHYDRIFYLLHRIRGSLAVSGYDSLIEQVEALGQSLRQVGLTAIARTNSLALMHALQRVSQPD